MKANTTEVENSSISGKAEVEFPKSKTLLSRDDLKLIGITVSNSSLLRWEYEGRFPRRVKLAGTRVAWLQLEIDAWLADRASERSNTHYADPY